MTDEPRTPFEHRERATKILRSYFQDEHNLDTETGELAALVALVHAVLATTTGGEYFVVQACALCRCTDDHPCADAAGQFCSWTTPSLCSACAELAEVGRTVLENDLHP